MSLICFPFLVRKLFMYNINTLLFFFNTWNRWMFDQLEVLKNKFTSIYWKQFLNFLVWNNVNKFPGGAEVKASACNVGDLGSIPGSGRSPGEGNGNPLQYSCLENPMDGGAWWATVHRSQRVGHNWATSLSLCYLAQQNLTVSVLAEPHPVILYCAIHPSHIIVFRDILEAH